MFPKKNLPKRFTLQLHTWFGLKNIFFPFKGTVSRELYININIYQLKAFFPGLASPILKFCIY